MILAGSGPTAPYEYNDLPVAFDANVNVADGYDSSHPAAYDVPAQCQPGA